MWLLENFKLPLLLACDLSWAMLLPWLPMTPRFTSKFLTMTVKALCDLTSASLAGLSVGHTPFGSIFQARWPFWSPSMPVLSLASRTWPWPCPCLYVLSRDLNLLDPFTIHTPSAQTSSFESASFDHSCF